MAILQKLTEGIVNRDLQKEGEALLAKWEATGLLEGLDDSSARNGMAVLLENQAKELLREASSMAGGDVEGFAAVAFPIVRRVFGGLIANQLVSVQPMSLPSGLIFFLDFQSSTPPGAKLGQPLTASLYGGGVVGHQLTGGVSLSGDQAEQSFYALNQGYSSPTASAVTVVTTLVASGTVGDGSELVFDGNTAGYDLPGLLRFDPDLVSGNAFAVGRVPRLTLTNAQLNTENLVAITIHGGPDDGNQIRRLTVTDPVTAGNYLIVVHASGTETSDTLGTAIAAVNALDVPIDDNFVNSPNAALGALVGDPTWGLENESNIPEIDIQVDSVSVTAITKKLKARWTPELAQDLNAYHNLDAEVELTSILSEQIALEIDREILEDLIKGATAETLFWSRRPGRFVVRTTGADIAGGINNEGLMGADFTGTVSEWYETLIETVNDVSAQIHRKTLRGGANFVVCSPEVANLLEFTAGFRASVTADVDTGTAGALKVGAISKKWDVYVDPYFPRNVLLVGRKGSSFLESGYVYAPYVPLQVTPTIFGIEDFVPRKGVMTRYAKKMVRPDMYGLVIVKDLLG